MRIPLGIVVSNTKASLRGKGRVQESSQQFPCH